MQFTVQYLVPGSPYFSFVSHYHVNLPHRTAISYILLLIQMTINISYSVVSYHSSLVIQLLTRVQLLLQFFLFYTQWNVAIATVLNVTTHL